MTQIRKLLFTTNCWELWEFYKSENFPGKGRQSELPRGWGFLGIPDPHPQIPGMGMGIGDESLLEKIPGDGDFRGKGWIFLGWDGDPRKSPDMIFSGKRSKIPKKRRFTNSEKCMKSPNFMTVGPTFLLVPAEAPFKHNWFSVHGWWKKRFQSSVIGSILYHI